MENEVFAPLLKKFTRSPLVTWVRTFGPLADENGTSLEEYMTLVDGVFLNEVMLQINPKSTNRNVNKRVNNDESLRIQNLCILVKKNKIFLPGMFAAADRDGFAKCINNRQKSSF